MDSVIEAYKKDIDRSLLRENLKLSVEERFLKFDAFMRGVMELRAAGERSRMERNNTLSTSEQKDRDGG